MSPMPAHIRNRLVGLDSTAFSSVCRNYKVQACTSYLHRLLHDSRFDVLGFADVGVSSYYLIGGKDAAGNFEEYLLSSDLLFFMSKAKDSACFIKMKLALDENSMNGFIKEYLIFAECCISL